MTVSSIAVEPLFSTLAGDPELHELIGLFVRELPARISAMQRAAAARDFAELGRLAHQLQGAGGSYGFPWLQMAAGRVEQAAQQSALGEEISVALVALAVTCDQVYAGANIPTPQRAARPDRAPAQRPAH